MSLRTFALLFATSLFSSEAYSCDDDFAASNEIACYVEEVGGGKIGRLEYVYHLGSFKIILDGSEIFQTNIEDNFFSHWSGRGNFYEVEVSYPQKMKIDQGQTHYFAKFELDFEVHYPPGCRKLLGSGGLVYREILRGKDKTMVYELSGCQVVNRN